MSRLVIRWQKIQIQINLSPGFEITLMKRWVLNITLKVEKDIDDGKLVVVIN